MVVYDLVCQSIYEHSCCYDHVLNEVRTLVRVFSGLPAYRSIDQHECLPMCTFLLMLVDMSSYKCRCSNLRKFPMRYEDYKPYSRKIHWLRKLEIRTKEASLEHQLSGLVTSLISTYNYVYRFVPAG